MKALEFLSPGRAGRFFKPLSAGRRLLGSWRNPAGQAQILKYGQSKGFAKLPLVSKAFEEIPQPTIDEISTAKEREGFKKELAGFFAEMMQER